jgi:hypothetical protein
MEAMWKRPGRVGIIAALVAATLVLWGGHGHHRPWTGISGRTATLWDWLNLLLLPVAFSRLVIVRETEPPEALADSESVAAMPPASR